MVVTPATTRRNDAGTQRSPSTTSTGRSVSARRSDRARTSTRTVAPSLSSSRTTLLPTKPVAPVTRTSGTASHPRQRGGDGFERGRRPATEMHRGGKRAPPGEGGPNRATSSHTAADVHERGEIGGNRVGRGIRDAAHDGDAGAT